MPSIQVTLPDGSEATYELTDDTITVGRVSDNAIQIEDASVSSHHGEFRQAGDGYVFVDTGSTNGSRLNGEALTPEETNSLTHGDELIFGSIPVRYLTQAGFEQPPSPEESEPALAPATTSVAPTDFSNASPFQKKGKDRDSKELAVLALGVLAFLGAGAAIFFVLQMQAPFGG